MSSLRERFGAFLDRQGCSWEGVGDDALTTSVQGEDGECYGVIVQTDEETEQLALYVVFPGEVPAERRLAVAELVTRANFGVVLGNLELDMDDGEVRAKAALDTEGLEISDTAWTNLFATAHELTERYLPAVEQVVAGAGPAEALAEVED